MEEVGKVILSPKMLVPKSLDVRCSCGMETKGEELLRINHQWSEDYNSLRDKYNKLRDVKGKYEKLKEELSATSSKLESFDETSKSYSEDEYQVIKQQLIIYKEDFDEQTKEKQELLEKNRILENQLRLASTNAKKYAIENKSMRAQLQCMQREKKYILKEVQRLATVLPQSLDLSCTTRQEKPKESIQQDTITSLHLDILEH